MTSLLRVAIVVLWMAWIIAPVSAKGATRRLVVTGPTVPVAIDITDPIALADVWGGEFIAEPTSEPDHGLSRYVVSFHVQPVRSREVKPMYVVLFVKDPQGGPGFIYLPGRGEDGYRLNVGTIMRAGHDGKWHRASPEWGRAIGARLR